jgi:hypothetical protein
MTSPRSDLSDNRLSAFTAQTPDPVFDALVNGFVQYQSAVTMRLSRSISSYEWGIGRSIGFRDSSQDQMGLMHAFSEAARDSCGAKSPPRAPASASSAGRASSASASVFRPGRDQR